MLMILKVAAKALIASRFRMSIAPCSLCSKQERYFGTVCCGPVRLSDDAALFQWDAQMTGRSGIGYLGHRIVSRFPLPAVGFSTTGEISPEGFRMATYFGVAEIGDGAARADDPRIDLWSASAKAHNCNHNEPIYSSAVGWLVLTARE